ncbi:MAG TPA: hypothetical protein VEO01_09350 [Pseudonocardiaceae bacterium]|nr:hypothetical protein [Pseudonocardiaceae bacterium]
MRPAGMVVAAVLVVVISSAATGCAQATSSTKAISRTTAQQACVQAVFDVLSGMVNRPFDNQPFQDFVTRYGTESVTYNAYRDSFAPFYDLAATQGVQGAEQHLRALITKECGAAR